MKTTFSKKEIRHNLEAALIGEIEKIEGSESSKKLKKVVRKATRNIALKVKLDLKKKTRKAAKHLDKTKAQAKNKKVKSKKDYNGYSLDTVEKVENGHA